MQGLFGVWAIWVEPYWELVVVAVDVEDMVEEQDGAEEYDDGDRKEPRDPTQQRLDLCWGEPPCGAMRLGARELGWDIAWSLGGIWGGHRLPSSLSPRETDNLLPYIPARLEGRMGGMRILGGIWGLSS